MRLRPLAGVFWSAIAGAAIACTGFGATTSSVTSDAGDGEGGGGVDAADEASDARAAPDAPTVDAGDFCSAHASAAFCEDFDRAELSPLLFPLGMTDGGLTTGAPARSPPAAAQMVTSGIVSSGPQYRVSPVAGTTPKHMRLAFALDPVQIDGQKTSRVGLAAIGPTGIDGKMHVRLETDGFALTLVLVAPNGTATAVAKGLVPALGTYEDVAIDVSYATTSTTATLIIGTTPVGSGAVDLPTPNAVEIAFGIAYASPATGGFHFAFDDVVFTAD